MFLLGLYEVHGLDLLQSLEWVQEILHVRIISGVVCHGDNDKCWSDGVMKCSYGGICDVIWNDFCVSYCNCDFDVCRGCDCDLDLLCKYLSSMMVSRSWSGAMPWVRVLSLYSVQACLSGGILSGQSAAIFIIHCIFIAFKAMYIWAMTCAMWPNSWHWKHWSSSLDITLTVDEGNRVAVNCYTAWGFSTFHWWHLLEFEVLFHKHKLLRFVHS